MSIAPKVIVSDMIDPRFLDKIENWNEIIWKQPLPENRKEIIFEKQCKFSQNIDWRRTSSRFIVTVGLSCNIESFGNVGLIEMFLTTRNF